MNQLEEYLKKSLRPHEPSLDFTDRVLARIPARRAGKWKELLSFLRRPGVPLFAAGAGVACMLILGVFLIRQAEPEPALKQEHQVEQAPPGDVGSTQVTNAPSGTGKEPFMESARTAPPRPRRAHSRITRRERLAKEQLMIALQIASAKLNEAQRLIFDLPQEPARGR
jgi:hypothetical protein